MYPFVNPLSGGKGHARVRIYHTRYTYLDTNHRTLGLMPQD